MSNKIEITNWKKYKELRNIMCPIVFHGFCGLMIIMKKAESLTDDNPEDSSVTDDSIMTIATADAIMNNKSSKESYLKWGNNYPNAGYGSSFRNWLGSKNHKPYNIFGNGSAMRVSPIVG